jgi:predicted DsbA family dithiol-disulfide isomerase
MSNNCRKTQTLDLKIFSDLICPFCYVGFRKTLKAIEMAKRDNSDINFKIKFQPYELDPALSIDTPISKVERYEAKFGESKFLTMMELMKARASEVEINLDYGGLGKLKKESRL